MQKKLNKRLNLTLPNNHQQW